MKNTVNRILFYLARAGLLLFFGCGLLVRCANPLAPQGGPRDSLAPRVIGTTPAYGAVDFKEKRVFIEFDEYIQLKDLAKEFFTSPTMKKKPMPRPYRRGVMIDIADTLLENTTYALNFGSSIQDNNEGNPLHGFRFVFSTGPSVDSMLMSGYTVDAVKKDSAAKSFILFFAADKDPGLEYDSTVLTQSADVIARAENNGIFVAENLKPIDYRIYAYQDENDNQQYDPGTDNVGFLDSVYNPAAMPGFRVWYDTIRKYISADPQLYFRMFRDEPFKRQVLNNQARPLQHKIILSFGAPYPQIESLRFDSLDSTRIIVEKLKPTGDSIAYWLDYPAEELPDSITGEMIYMHHDSLRNLTLDTAKLTLVWKRPVLTRQQERDMQEKEKEKQAAIERGEEPPAEPNPFRYRLLGANPMNPELDLPISFDYPLVSMDSLAFSLTRSEENKVFRVPIRIERDTADLRTWIIRAAWAKGQNYSLTIPAGALCNVAGEVNDTIKSDFAVMDPDKYATMILSVTGGDTLGSYILQLVDETGDKVIDEIGHASAGEYTFRYLEPGPVRIRVVEDMNDNGQWDKGDLIQRRQPERVELFVPEDGAVTIETKAGWTMDYPVDMSKLFAPPTMESIAEQIRREEEVFVKKYLEELAKKRQQELERQQQGTSSGSNSFNPSGAMNMFR